MEYLHAEFLVVLGPALLSAILGLLVNTPSLGVSLRSILGSREHVETLLGLMINSAFVGTAAGALFGYGGDSREAYLMGGVVGLAALFAVTRLSKLSAQLASSEAKVSHRKMAGTVRSIIRSELHAANSGASILKPGLNHPRKCSRKLHCHCQNCCGTPLKVERPGHRIKGIFK